MPMHMHIIAIAKQISIAFLRFSFDVSIIRPIPQNVNRKFTLWRNYGILRQESAFFSQTFVRNPHVYSKTIPAAVHCFSISVGQIDACTSPTCAFSSISIQRRDCPMPPPIVNGSVPSAII